jgi:hypothetical protein
VEILQVEILHYRFSGSPFTCGRHDTSRFSHALPIFRHRNLPKPRGIVAISPAVELNGDLRPPTSNDPMLPKWLVKAFHQHYNMTRDELTDASIFYENDLSFLPDTFVMVRFQTPKFKFQKLIVLIPLYLGV